MCRPTTFYLPENPTRSPHMDPPLDRAPRPAHAPQPATTFYTITAIRRDPPRPPCVAVGRQGGAASGGRVWVL